MNIELIQDQIATLLAAHVPLASVPVLLDDGTYPQTTDRETALNTQGLVIIIWEVTGGSPIDAVSRGTRNAFSADIAISVEENRVVNQGTGLGLHPDFVTREVISAIAGLPANDELKPAQESWANLGNVGGINLRIINFTNKTII